ncbi:BMP family protein [Nocardioides caldifontis]|uniref:BMP family protein n=1 Tax=Nocardioides caldifontis TaxID=2588938 RepID=UPI0011E023DB|nr:BMP family protein [Nocardioides caldifontis]
MKTTTAALGLLLATALVGCGGTTSEDTREAGTGSSSGDAPKVAALFTQFVDQGNWDVAGYDAFTAMCEKYDFDCDYVEEASYERAPALLRQYAQDGYAMVITHSSGYAAAIEEIAPEFPDTEFVLFSYATDTKGLDNYSAWSVDWDQAGYLQGVIGGLASPKGNISILGGEQIPSTERAMALAEKGAQSVNPDVKVSTVWTGTFVDVAKAKQVAAQTINDGADFVIPMADLAGQGVHQAAADQGALSLGEYLDENSKYPSAIVTSVTVDMEGAFDQIGEAFTNDELNGQIEQMNAQSGAFDFAPFHNVDAAVEKKAREVLDGIADGSTEIPAV